MPALTIGEADLRALVNAVVAVVAELESRD
jgi:hypothetical protein